MVTLCVGTCMFQAQGTCRGPIGEGHSDLPPRETQAREGPLCWWKRVCRGEAGVGGRPAVAAAESRSRTSVWGTVIYFPV